MVQPVVLCLKFISFLDLLCYVCAGARQVNTSMPAFALKMDTTLCSVGETELCYCAVQHSRTVSPPKKKISF